MRAMRDRMENPPSERIRTALEELIAPMPCPSCEGKRLQPESLAVKVNGQGIADYTSMPITDASKKFESLVLSPRDEKIAGLVLKEIKDRPPLGSAI
jgi:excinuclease ABC subunit A